MFDQVADDLEVDVGLEQGHADLAQSFGNVFFSERALAAKALEYALQFVRKVLKHRSASSLSGPADGRHLRCGSGLLRDLRLGYRLKDRSG